MKTFAAIASATVVLVATAVPVAHAATWRTVVVATDQDYSEHGSLVLVFGTTLDRVSALRLVVRVNGTLYGDARIDCGEGSSLRRRTVTLSLRRGVYPVPVPNPEGPCIVRVNVGNGDPGAATVKLQYLP